MKRASDRTIARLRAAYRLGMLCMVFVTTSLALAQNSLVGDGFGGRLWYRPTNFSVGSYTGFSLGFIDPCDSTTNQLYGWGGNFFGELAMDGSVLGSNMPVPIQGMAGTRYYSTGYCMGAIKLDRTGWVWGDVLSVPPLHVIDSAKFVDASVYSVSFVKQDGTVWSIGENTYGSNGDGTYSSNYASAVQMLGVNSAVRVASSYRTTIVLKADGTLLSTGSNDYGLLGDNSGIAQRNTVGAIPDLDSIVDIKAITEACIALRANGDVYTWGAGPYIGDGDVTQEDTPKRLMDLHDIVAISASCDGYHFMALDKDKNCYAWANNLAWQGGVATPGIIPSPLLVATDVIDIMAGETFSYIVRSNGSLWATGGSLAGSGSIWLDLPDTPRFEFTEIHPPDSIPIALIGTVATPTSSYCGQSSGSITVHHFGTPAPYQYNIGQGPQNSNVFMGLAPGTYNVTVTDANGCTFSTTCTIDLDQTGTLTQPVNATICTNEHYTLPSGSVVDTAGTYMDTVVTVNACDTVYIVDLQVVPMIQRTVHDTLCQLAPYTLPSGLVVIGWGEYADTLLVNNACDTIFHVFLIQGVAPPVTTSADVSIGACATTTLQASGGSAQATYAWSPTINLSCPTCSSSLVSPPTTAQYCVVLTEPNGCTDTACVIVTVVADAQVFVPSAFSPNASGKNDLECVFGNCIQEMVFSIYDRWGNKVFESTDPKACWDGTYNGQALDPAVFVYHLSATMTNGEQVERQGNISLVR